MGEGKTQERPRAWNQTALSSNLTSSPSLQRDLDTVLTPPSLSHGLSVSLWLRTRGEELGFTSVVIFFLNNKAIFFLTDFSETKIGFSNELLKIKIGRE